MSEHYHFAAAPPFEVRGFNMCESLLRHTPEQLRRFLRRMKSLDFNSIIIHYDYGWKRYKDIIIEECRNAGVEITLMTFGPRSFYSMMPWSEHWFAKNESGEPFTRRPECETQPCAFAPGALDAFEEGAYRWLKELPPEIRRVHMRAGDGYGFCLCPRCRVLPPKERWQPFVERFVRAVSRISSPPAIETDIYYSRYELPEDHTTHKKLDRIMYDPFPRSPLFPLEGDPHAPEVHRELVKNLENWCRLAPGRVYIHENAMKQSYFSIFQHGTGAAVADLNTFRRLGVAGVCYEAYEPGYHTFAEMFEILSGALKGQETAVEFPREMRDSILKDGSMFWGFGSSNDFRRFTSDPAVLKNIEMIRQMYFGTIDRKFFLEYSDFLLENRDKMDWIYGCYSVTKLASQRGIPLKFKELSPLAADFSTRKKLWDFMEDIPMTEDPLTVCFNVITELRSAML